jgi:O-antigen/teichoic acid export membrane protein
MSDEHDAERTFQPTPKRLEQAREKGQVARSRELATAAVALSGAIALWWVGPELYRNCLRVFRTGLGFEREAAIDPDRMLAGLSTLSMDMLVAIAPLLGLVLVLGVGLLTGLSAVAALIAFDLAVIATALVLLFFFSKFYLLLRRAGEARRRPKELLTFSLPVYASDLLGSAGPQIRTLALGALETTASVGVFAVATQVNTVGQLFHSSFVMASMPIVSELHGQGAREQMKRFYQTVTKWTFTLNLPLFLIITLFPGPILSIFGESYVGGATALTILAWANLINTGTGICGVVIDMTGNTRLKLLNTVVTLLLTVGLSLWLIPQWGVNGAAVATLAAIAALNLLRLGQVYHLFRMLPYRRDFFKPVVAGLAAWAAVLALVHLWPVESDLIQLAVGIVVLFALYTGMLVLLRLSAEDRMVLQAFARRFTRGKPSRSRVPEDWQGWK